jgi:C1A family cysteine protease
VGWDPNLYGGAFIFENSWGDWADGGFGYISPDVVASDDSFDFLAMMGGWEEWSSK